MPKVIMGVGLPGSGKTTALKALAEKYSYTYIAPDDIRFELQGNASDQSGMKEVWETAHRRTAEALERGEDVVFDATFYKGFERRNFIQFAKEHGADKVQGLFAAVELDISDERNRNRERVVPRYAMERMSEWLHKDPPVVEDGFDAVFDINEFQELERAEKTTESGEIQEREFKPKLK